MPRTSKLPVNPRVAETAARGDAGRADAASLRRVGVLIALGAALLGATVSLSATRWIGRTFPGFFVLANRVVPSISLSDWRAGEPSRLFQHEILAVDGTPVDSSEAVYAHVRALPPGTPVRYLARSPEGRTTTLEVATRRFSGKDYLLLFGAYLLNGVVFIAAGLLAFFLYPRSAASAGILSLGLTTGVFVLTAGDLYGPHWFFRLHVIAESLMAASFLHLALVFPIDRIRGQRSTALQAVYLPLAALAALYQAGLYWPVAYSVLHLVATATHSLGASVWIAIVTYDLFSSPSAIVRRAILVVALGTLSAFLAPVVLWAASAILSGSVPLNAAALTAFLFPLSVGYAIARQRLLEGGDRVPGAVRVG